MLYLAPTHIMSSDLSNCIEVTGEFKAGSCMMQFVDLTCQKLSEPSSPPTDSSSFDLLLNAHDVTLDLPAANSTILSIFLFDICFVTQLYL